MRLRSRTLFFGAVLLSVVLCVEMSVKAAHPEQKIYGFSYIRQGLEYLLINIVYLLWLLPGFKRANSQPEEGCRTFWQFVGRSKVYFLLPLLAFLIYPQTSDIYLYLQYGLMAINHINPYLNPTTSFPSALSNLTVWFLPSTYGPVSLSMFTAAAPFASFGVAAGVYAFKVLCLLFHFFNTYLIWAGLKEEKLRTFVTTAYLINPILLFELVSNAHVDVFLISALILLINCLRNRRYGFAVISAWAGLMTKVIPIVWLPLLFAFLIRNRRWSTLAVSCLFSAGLIAVLSYTILPEKRAWLGLVNPATTWQAAGSLHQIWGASLDIFKPALDKTILTRNKLFIGFKLLGYLSYCVYYAWRLLCVFAKPDYSVEQLISDLGWATLALFLLASAWYQPWYSAVLLPFVALNLRDRFAAVVYLTFAVCSSCSYYLLAYGPGSLLLLVSLITVVPTLLLLLHRNRILLKLTA